MTPEERQWAFECWRAGDTLEDIAPEVGLSPADLAKALNLYRPLPDELRFRPCRGTAPKEFVGRLLKVVALDRRWSGEAVRSIAVSAGMSKSGMESFLKANRCTPFTRTPPVHQHHRE